tara:strand:+ start:22191 stop:23582 length:1392 start_codon:yes stop_codon:yes gene_type:complete
VDFPGDSMDIIASTDGPQAANDRWPQRVRLQAGRFQNLRRAVSWPLLGLFLVFPWLSLNGTPWLRFSFDSRRIHVFGQTLLWQDLPLLSFLLFAGAFGLFLVSALWGRLWCGFACPQSVWTWIFMRIESLVERRLALPAGLTRHHPRAAQLARSSIKHGLWIAVSLATAFTFSAYFVAPERLLAQLLGADLPAYTAGWLLAMTLLTYVNAGFVREYICLHACPYSRFQSVMFDRDTVTVSYDSRRGDPRASLRSRQALRGDCVDCRLCVAVCPTRIDIRDGLQAGCIDCGACIDACDQVMRKLDRAPGLIRFVSARQLESGQRRRWRPRVIGYALMTATALSLASYKAFNTRELNAEIRRDRSSLFVRDERGRTCNHYQFKIEAASTQAQRVRVRLQAGAPYDLVGPEVLDTGGSDTGWVPYSICLAAPRQRVAQVGLVFTGGGAELVKETTFIAATAISERG